MKPISYRTAPARKLAALALLTLLAVVLTLPSAFPPPVAQAQTPANQAATGTPRILLSADSPTYLSVDPYAIRDGNGGHWSGGTEKEYNYTYQWIRVDGQTAVETNLVGVESSTTLASGYYLVEADVGHYIKVEVSFTDSDGYNEKRTTPLFGPVRRRVRPVAKPIAHPGRQYRPVGFVPGSDHPAVRPGLQAGQSRPGLRNLQRLDRPGRGAVGSDRLPVGRRRPSWDHTRRGHEIQAVRLHQPTLLQGRPETGSLLPWGHSRSRMSNTLSCSRGSAPRCRS